MSAFYDNMLMGASGSQGYQISRSVRLRKSASAYFNRTPGSASNQKTHTISFWTKWSVLGADANMISFGNTLSYQITWGNSGRTLACGSQVLGVSNPWFVDSTASYRDPGSWYHIVIAVDTTQATASNRVKMYVNGVQITSFGTANYPTLNYDTGANSATAHSIGRREDNAQYYDGYFTEFNWIDGQQLTPSSFGETNAITGVWQPKKYTGTYGTNGFYLTFADNSAATAAAIGKDYSGNGNNWTPNNVSLTAGTTYDSMVDVPTPYANRGNYCTLNPLRYSTSGTLSSGMLNYANASADNFAKAFATFGISTGKWYYEAAYVSGVSDSRVSWGFGTDTTAVGTVNLPFEYSFNTQGSNTMQVAIDYDAGKIWYGFNNTWVSSGDPATGANPYQTFTPSSYPVLVPGVRIYGANDGTTTSAGNFGQRPFAYTPPTGFNALNTQNLSASTITNGANYMAATLYTGTGATQTLSNAVSGISFQPDLVWIKSRSAATDNKLTNSVTGVTKALATNSTAAETTDATGVTAFGTSGFTIGSGANYNTSAATYVAWQWKRGATPGFDVVSYTGTGVARTVAHTLGVVPSMIFTKNRTNAVPNWLAYHSSIGASNFLIPNTTAAVAASAAPWNNTAPTSTVFSVGTSSASNESGVGMVAYLWAPVAGYSAFGSYTGNGNADGPFVYLGFRPRWVMIKRTDAATFDWIILDSSRGTYNANITSLLMNGIIAEVSGVYSEDLLSNGFKLRNAGNGQNASGGTYIYAAFCENPFKYSLAR